MGEDLLNLTARSNQLNLPSCPRCHGTWGSILMGKWAKPGSRNVSFHGKVDKAAHNTQWQALLSGLWTTDATNRP